MRLHLPFVVLGSAVLFACTTAGTKPDVPERGVTPGFVCNSDDLGEFVGQSADGDVGAKALNQSGAKSLRWIPPNSAVSMDFRQDRLNIEYDENMTITRISCG